MHRWTHRACRSRRRTFSSCVGLGSEPRRRLHADQEVPPRRAAGPARCGDRTGQGHDPPVSINADPESDSPSVGSEEAAADLSVVTTVQAGSRSGRWRWRTPAALYRLISTPVLRAVLGWDLARRDVRWVPAVSGTCLEVGSGGGFYTGPLARHLPSSGTLLSLERHHGSLAALRSRLADRPGRHPAAGVRRRHLPAARGGQRGRRVPRLLPGGDARSVPCGRRGPPRAAARGPARRVPVAPGDHPATARPRPRPTCTSSSTSSGSGSDRRTSGCASAGPTSSPTPPTPRRSARRPAQSDGADRVPGAARDSS